METCASQAECNLNTIDCRPCAYGEQVCRGNALERCSEGGWSPVDTCQTTALCLTGLGGTVGECLQSLCEPGWYCNGPRLERCSADRDRFELVALCATSELCDAAFAEEAARAGEPATCRPAACAPNAYRCDGANLLHCRPERTGWVDVTTCGSPGECNVTRAGCFQCSPGDVECNAEELRRCTDSGAWTVVERCATAALCDAVSERCGEPDCLEPGTFRCNNESLPILEICTEDLTWAERETCEEASLCVASAGRCLAPACEVNEFSCRGQERLRCREDRTQWDVIETCGVADTCYPEDGCLVGGCDDFTVRCNGANLEHCIGGRFVVQERCLTAALCDPIGPTCLQPMCNRGYDCMGSIVSVCSPGRDSWSEVFTCPIDTACDPLGTKGRAECDICLAGGYECQGNGLFRCAADGQTLPKVADCPTGCSVIDGVPSCQ